MGQDNTPITDEQRRLAESKKLTLQPVSSRVVTDDLPDEQIATNHMVGPTLPNTTNDIEQNSAPIQPSASALENDTQPSSRKTILHYSAASIVILAIFAVGGVITGAVFFLIQ
jgi:hypothetical protein